LIEGIINLMDTPDDFAGPMNLGNPCEITILELAERVIEITNSKSELIYKDLPCDDPIQRKPDISLAKKMISWEPRTSLGTGLEKTVAYFDKLLYNHNNASL
jgi:UDP-glucuronate decarboxylase